jgi:hypothetical protein
VVNAGLITAGYTHTAVALADGGSVTNQSGGTIIGTQHLAIYMTGALAGTVVNDGSIISLGTTTGASGIVFQAGGYVSNAIRRLHQERESYSGRRHQRQSHRHECWKHCRRQGTFRDLSYWWKLHGRQFRTGHRRGLSL